MRIVNCEQGSIRWQMARLGIPTASCFDKIVTPKGKPVTGKSRNTYMMQLLAERITGEPPDHFESFDMRRGHELEPLARAEFSKVSGLEVQTVGFVLGDGERWGASPDGLMFDDGLEIKCLNQNNHMKYLVAGVIPDEFYVQGIGEMWVCDRFEWTLFMYTDAKNVPNMALKWEHDEAVVSALEEQLPIFCDELDAAEDALREKYDIPPRNVKPLTCYSNDWCPFPGEDLTPEQLAAMPEMDGGSL